MSPAPTSEPASDHQPLPTATEAPACGAVASDGARVAAAPAADASGWGVFWREWLKPLAIIGLMMMTFRSAVADWNDVPTGSMKPTIIEGDRIFINKVAYDLKVPFTTIRIFEWANPTWGDIVVLRSPEDGKRLVKRVVGLPGDRIEIRRGRLLVNGTPAEYLALAPEIINQIDLQEQPSYIFATESLQGHAHATMFGMTGSQRDFGPFTVPEHKYFVMGDNRDNSYDSRRFGPVDHDAILGQATGVALSLDHSDYFMPRWDRFFSRLR